MTSAQASEFDHWFSSDTTLPVDGEHVWARRTNGTIFAAIYVNHPNYVYPLGRGKFVVEGDAGEGDMWGLVFWQPRTTVIL
jgi:hypothetical protein